MKEEGDSPDKPTEIIDPERLLFRLNSGEQLKAEELEAVVTMLQSVEDPNQIRALSIDDIYSLLLVIGRARSYEHRHLLETHLESKDPATVSLVLDILCNSWQLTAEYLERLLSFSLGVSWDTDEDVRQTAIRALGEYLFDAQTNPDFKIFSAPQRRVLELLLGIFEDSSVDQWSRQITYFALCRAARLDWEQIPSECSRLNLEDDSEEIDREMLARLKKELA